MVLGGSENQHSCIDCTFRPGDDRPSKNQMELLFGNGAEKSLALNISLGQGHSAYTLDNNNRHNRENWPGNHNLQLCM